MKKILLFADIGGHDTNKYYHVGDEAMFYETYRWYKKQKPIYKLTTFSWFPTHESLKIGEKLHLSWTQKTYVYLPQLVFKLFLFKLTTISLFSKKEFIFIQTIGKQDIIHFSGGGNMSSAFRKWLYYCFFVIVTAKLFGKKIMLTSQTIGPIWGLDWILSFVILNLVDFIGIRQPTNRKSEFKKYGVFLPEIYSMLDAAYSVPISKNGIQIQKNNITIGLSIHKWFGREQETILLLQNVLADLSKKYTISILLIPHHISQSNDADVTFMKEIVSKLPKQIHIYTPTIPSHIKADYATYIKKITSQADILLTTRYHGLIFALSENVPAIALNYDLYYRIKNNGALEWFYKNQKINYQVMIKNKCAEAQLINKMKTLLDNLSQEKQLLKEINEKIQNTNYTLHSVLQKLEFI